MRILQITTVLLAVALSCLRCGYGLPVNNGERETVEVHVYAVICIGQRHANCNDQSVLMRVRGDPRCMQIRGIVPLHVRC